MHAADIGDRARRGRLLSDGLSRLQIGGWLLSQIPRILRRSRTLSLSSGRYTGIGWFTIRAQAPPRGPNGSRKSCVSWKTREAALGARAWRAIGEVGKRLDLDFAGVDFAVLSDGRALLFEANATMYVHPEPPDSALAHKNRFRAADSRSVLDSAGRRLTKGWGREKTIDPPILAPGVWIGPNTKPVIPAKQAVNRARSRTGPRPRARGR